MDADLTVLEQKVIRMIAQVNALRETNETLERELVDAQARNRTLTLRMQAAGSRLDALLARMPGDGA
ncbi:MAG TPA: hypothetical protein VNE58_05330 [Casimicrobiaceae bacterium]|nr:hypothetical protein [Casimicrobiaceae bacterium]